MNYIEELNKTRTVFVCFNSNDVVMFGSVSKSEAVKYCNKNECEYSVYPPCCYMHDKEYRLDELFYGKTENRTKLVVGDKHTLGYMNPITPNTFNVLKANTNKGAIYTTNISYNLDISQFKNIRLASAKDFENFNVSFVGFDNKNDYLYE